MWYKRWKSEHIIFSFSYALCGIDIVVIVCLMLLQCLQTSQSTRTTSIFASKSAFIIISSLFSSKRREKKIQYCIVNVSCTSIYLYDIANDVDDFALWHTHTHNQSVCSGRCYCTRVSYNHLYFLKMFNAAYQRVRMRARAYKINCVRIIKKRIILFIQLEKERDIAYLDSAPSINFTVYPQHLIRI